MISLSLVEDKGLTTTEFAHLEIIFDILSESQKAVNEIICIGFTLDNFSNSLIIDID